MNRLLFSTIILVASACNSDGDKNYDGNADSTTYVGNPHYQLIPASAIPPGISVKGNVEEAWRFTDLNGEHILVLSRYGPVEVPGTGGEDLGQTIELYYSLYLVDSGRIQRVLWAIDSEEECPLDITCAFLPGSTTITDLDSNGIAEIKIQYEKTCRGDVSPSNMKLVMYEGNNKYELRGARWIATSPGDVFTVTEETVNLENLPIAKDEVDQMIQSFGRYESERFFEDAPPVFLSFAKREWLKYAKETIPGSVTTN